MQPTADHQFSDVEVEQIGRVAREEFETDSEWTVQNVARRPKQPDVVEVTIKSVRDRRLLTIELLKTFVGMGEHL